MSIVAERIGRLFRPGWRRLWAFGLGVPIIAGIVLVLLVLMSFTRSPYQAPKLVSAGLVEQYKRGAPVYFEQERVWVVRLPDDRMIALYDVNPESSCSTPWRSQYEFMGKTGWFHEACRGSSYDLEGRCFGGPCTVAMSHFGVLLQNTEVIVDLSDLKAGPPRDDNAVPLTPEQQP